MGNRITFPAILLALLGVLFIAFAIFYATTDTGLLASSVTRHYKHAVVFTILAVLSFVGANFARGRQL
ncbi:MAG: hypothetical protein NVS3B18_05370 [Candidatus Dormibacteria bacterium]